MAQGVCHFLEAAGFEQVAQDVPVTTVDSAATQDDPVTTVKLAAIHVALCCGLNSRC
jgi:hypothetical protein